LLDIAPHDLVEPDARDKRTGGRTAAPGGGRTRMARFAGQIHRLGPLVLAVLLAAGAAPIQAETWPSRIVHIVLPFPPGGPSDLLARGIAQTLSEQTQQSVVVDNRPGGSGLIGNDVVAKAAPDGYTLGLPSAGSMAIVPNLLQAPYDRDRDLVPITIAARVPEVMVLNPQKVAATSLQEVLAIARARPGTLNFGSTGNGSPVHLVLERMKQLSGVDIVHVPYKGAALALQDILAGQIELTAADAPGVLPHMKSGALRAVAETDIVRLPAMPDVPTFAEAGLPGVEMVNWYAVIAPSGLAPALLARIHDTMMRVLHDPALTTRLGAQGLTLASSTPDEAAAFIRAETRKWGDVARAANVHLD
jgi:tripartite-type tricarboxylate transporter receptor subunit TctC